MKRVLLLGKGELAIRTGEWFLGSPDHDLVAVVPVVPEPEWAPSLLDWCRSRGVDHVVSGLAEDGVRLTRERAGADPDLTISVFYDRILSRPFLRGCGRAVNLHNGPLPRYRGMSPVNWALKNGEPTHGVTLHEITPGIDDGPVLGQVIFTIDPDSEEVEDVYRRCLRYGWTLLQDCLPRLDGLVAREQDNARALHHTRADQDRLGDRLGFRRPPTPVPNS